MTAHGTHFLGFQSTMWLCCWCHCTLLSANLSSSLEELLNTVRRWSLVSVSQYPWDCIGDFQAAAPSLCWSCPVNSDAFLALSPPKDALDFCVIEMLQPKLVRMMLFGWTMIGSPASNDVPQAKFHSSE